MRSKARAVWGLLALVAVWLAITGQRHLVKRDYVLDGVLFLAIAVVVFVLAIARGGVAEPDLWPHAAPSSHEDEVPLVHAPWLLAVAGLFALAAFAWLSKNRFTWRGTLCWWAALVSWLLVVVRVRRRVAFWRGFQLPALKAALRRTVWTVRLDWAWLAILAILIVSFVFRLYRIDAIPTDPESDHVEASLDVQDILDGQYRIFFPRNTGREPTQFYLTAALSRVFGFGFVTLKLTMALVGALNVIPMYLLGKELLNRKLGLLAAFFTAISYWHVIISRIGLRISLAPLWTSVTLYFLFRALRAGKRNDFVWTGMSLGLGLYGYMAFRIVPLLIVVLCALKLLLDRGPGFDLKRFVMNLIVLVVTSAVVFLPLLRYMYDEPKAFWYRTLTRTTTLETGIQRSATEVFADNVKNALLMFNWIGDDAWPEGVGGKPSLDYVSGALLVLGMAYLLYLLLCKRRALALYFLAAVFVLLLPSTLAIAFPNENPGHLRASAVLPVVLSVVSLAAYLVGRQVIHALRGGTGLLLVVVLGGMLLWQAARANWQIYFEEYRLSYSRAAWNATDMARVINGFANSLGNRDDAWVVCSPYWVDGRAVSLMLGDIRWHECPIQPEQLEPHLLEPRNHLYIYNPVNSATEQWLLAHYPNGQLMRYQAEIPDKDFMVFFAPVQPSQSQE